MIGDGSSVSSARDLMLALGLGATPYRYFRPLLTMSHLTPTGPRTHPGKQQKKNKYTNTQPETQRKSQDQREILGVRKGGRSQPLVRADMPKSTPYDICCLVSSSFMSTDRLSDRPVDWKTRTSQNLPLVPGFHFALCRWPCRDGDIELAFCFLCTWSEIPH